MTTNPEIQSSTSETPEAQEVIESSKASSDSLKEEISTTAWTKKELSKWFSEFFERLKTVRNEIKQGNINKAIAILFWQTDEEPPEQQTSSSSTDTTNTSKQETSSEPTDSNETPVISDNSSKTELATEESEEKEKEPKDSDIVFIKKYIPSIMLDMRYATTNNFTWQKIYENDDAKLRYWTIKKLKVAQDELNKQWYSIKIWDAYRPQSAQERLRSVRPDSTLVAPPKKGSAHTKWNTVDITLVKSDWTEIPMPSEFDDDNKKRIDRDYNDLTSEQRANAKILEDAMKKAGFVWYSKEWWHYSDSTDYEMKRGE